MALGFQIELEFGNVGFWGEGETGIPGEKPLGARTRTNNLTRQEVIHVDLVLRVPDVLAPLQLHPDLSVYRKFCGY